MGGPARRGASRPPGRRDRKRRIAAISIGEAEGAKKFERFSRFSSWDVGDDVDDVEGESRPKVRAKLQLGEERRGKVDKQGTRKNKDEKSPRLSSVVDRDAKDDYVVAMASDVRALKNMENQKYSSRQEMIETLRVAIGAVGSKLLENPDRNVSYLDGLLHLCLSKDLSIFKLACLSLSVIFKDLTPGYKIREITEKELRGPVSADVRHVWDYETRYLAFYQQFIKLLVHVLEGRGPSGSRRGYSAVQTSLTKRIISLRALSLLLTTNPHFNFRTNIAQVIVSHADCTEAPLSQVACGTLHDLFSAHSLHESSVEAAELLEQLITRVLADGHGIRSEVLATFHSLRLRAELKDKLDPRGQIRDSSDEDREKSPDQAKLRVRGKQRREKLAGIRSQYEAEVTADYKHETTVPRKELRARQARIVHIMFVCYFKVLKCVDMNHLPLIERARMLPPVLEGIVRNSHLLGVDLLTDLLGLLKQLITEQTKPGGLMAHDAENFRMHESHPAGEEFDEGALLVGDSAALHCLHTSSVILRYQGQAMSIDFNEYHGILYGLMNRIQLKGRPESWIKTMQVLLLRDTHLDKARIAAFVKRLGMLALHQSQSVAMSFISLAKILLQSNQTVHRLLDGDNDGQGAGGAYRPDIDSPQHCNALASCVWEQCLLQDHFHPGVRELAAELVRSGRTKRSRGASLAGINAPLELFELHCSKRGEFNPVPQMPRGVSKHSKIKIEEVPWQSISSDARMLGLGNLADGGHLTSLSAQCSRRVFNFLLSI